MALTLICLSGPSSAEEAPAEEAPAAEDDK